MTDYKQLCAELYSIFEKYDDDSNLGGIYRDMEADGIDILDRARAALAEPEPEGPTNAEIHAVADELLDGDSASRVDFARAVLARWGQPS